MPHSGKQTIKRVLFFGIFDTEYARTRVFAEGFKALGYEVVLCRVDPRTSHGAHKYSVLWKKGKAMRNEQFGHVFVLFPGHTVVWLARLLFGNRIVFDSFVSLFDSNVCDRKLYGAYSPKAIRDHFLDWYSCALARTIIADTKAHERYFIEHIGVSEHKIIVVPVGAETAWFATQTRDTNNDTFTIGFYGTYIPLHGISTIVRTAALMKNEPIHFRIVGRGQEYDSVRALAKELGGIPNVEFISTMPRDELIKNMSEADVCLGIFGSTGKAQRVIPNKVYQCAALGKPIITADTPAIREVFTDKENIFLISPVSPDTLARGIRNIATDTVQRKLVASAARKLMKERYTPERIVKKLLNVLSRE